MKTNKEKIEGIVERIENSNGTAIKFADGTMICTKVVSFLGIPVTTEIGSLYTTGDLELRQLGEKFYRKSNHFCNKIRKFRRVYIYL